MAINKDVIKSSVESSRWKGIVRKGWYVIAAAVIVLFLVAFTTYLFAVVAVLQDPLLAPEPSLWADMLKAVSFMIRIVATLLSLGMAVVLFRKRSEQQMGLFLAYFLLIYGVVMTGPLSFLAPVWPGIDAFTMDVLQPALFIPMFIIFLCSFPDGQFQPRWTRWLATGMLVYVPLSLGVRTVFFGSTTVAALGNGVSVILLIIGLSAQIYRYRHVSNIIERDQTKWVMYGLAIMFLMVGILGWLSIRSNDLPTSGPLPWWLPLGGLGWSLAVAVLPISLTIAVLYHRLFDIDLVINRTLVYGALTAAVVIVYGLIIGGLGAIVQMQGNLVISLLATGLIAVVFHPLRQRLQRAVNRLMYGNRDEPFEALADLGTRLERTLTPDQIYPTIVETVAHTLKFPYVAIALRQGDGFEEVEVYGSPTPDPMAFPLIHHAQVIGRLLVGPRASGEGLSKADERVLHGIARQAGTAVYAAQSTRELRQSRLRLVTAREDERRRLRRDLHDGLGPVIASQGLKMAAVRQLIYTDPLRAEELLEALAAQNEATVAEIRRLVYELRPAALDDLGLVGAIRDYASGLKSSEGSKSARIKVKISASPATLPTLPAAIEVAAYRITTEALTNVARHAGACEAAISFEIVDQNHSCILHLQVIDDGVGLARTHRSGVGLLSMRERAEEVGGTLCIESAPGQGTCVQAELPLPEKE